MLKSWINTEDAESGEVYIFGAYVSERTLVVGRKMYILEVYNICTYLNSFQCT
jgi:hypothetical protein